MRYHTRVYVEKGRMGRVPFLQQKAIDLVSDWLPTVINRGFHGSHKWRVETMKQFCMKIDIISQGRENVFLGGPSSTAAMT